AETVQSSNALPCHHEFKNLGAQHCWRARAPEKKNELSRRRPFGVGSSPALPFRGTIGIVQLLECSQGKGDRAATDGGQLARIFLYPAGERPALMANVHTNRSRCDRFTVPLFSQLVCSGVDASPCRLERPLRVRRTAVKKRPLDQAHRCQSPGDRGSFG